MPGTDRLGQALQAGPILLDAAMGTRLIARGLDLAHEDPSVWSLDHSETVLAIHRLDVQAGSDAVLTNTFGANRTWLARTGRSEQRIAINREAVSLARQAVGPDRLVLGSIGPTTDDPAVLLDQAEALIDADALILETHRLDQAVRSLTILRSIGLPVLASLWEWPEPIGDAVRKLEDAGARAIGANCVIGVRRALFLAQQLKQATSLPILIKPSAGLHGSSLESPQAFEAAALELVELGVALIGGCCGTTEAHVAAIHRGRSSFLGKDQSP